MDIDKIQQLRILQLKLEVSGTAIDLSNTTLYKDSFGFVLLSVLVPITQNFGGAPLLTVFRTVINARGVRQQYKKDVYTLLYIGTKNIDGSDYMVFEGYLPRSFTEIEGDLELIFNYIETKQRDNGDGTFTTVISSRMTTNIYQTRVNAGGASETPLELDLDDAIIAQINANTIAIELLNDIVDINIPISTYVEEQIENHNIDPNAHEDIRKGISEQIENHNVSPISHQDIRKELEDIVLGGQITLSEVEDLVNNGIETHNTDPNAHEDIRQDITNIDILIPSAANISNKLMDRQAVIAMILNQATRYLTFTAAGEPFPTAADLKNASDYYYEGNVVPPSNNDFAIVVKDETNSDATARWAYNGTEWLYQYTIINSDLTQDQWDAINSGANQALIAQITTNKNNIAQNTQDIATNTQDVATNTQDISQNTQDISQNTQDIATNTQDIANLENVVNQIEPDLLDEIAKHNTNLTAHDNIQTALKTEWATDINTSVAAHNTSSSAHPSLQSDLANKVDSVTYDAATDTSTNILTDGGKVVISSFERANIAKSTFSPTGISSTCGTTTLTIPYSSDPLINNKTIITNGNVSKTISTNSGNSLSTGTDGLLYASGGLPSGGSEEQILYRPTNTTAGWIGLKTIYGSSLFGSGDVTPAIALELLTVNVPIIGAGASHSAPANISANFAAALAAFNGTCVISMRALGDPMAAEVQCVIPMPVTFNYSNRTVDLEYRNIRDIPSEKAVNRVVIWYFQGNNLPTL